MQYKILFTLAGGFWCPVFIVLQVCSSFNFNLLDWIDLFNCNCITNLNIILHSIQNKIYTLFIGVCCWNPAFDVTPASLISGIITERGVFRPNDLVGKLSSSVIDSF